jgi:hypothetical protein
VLQKDKCTYNQCEIEIEKNKIELLQKKKYAPQYGQLALQERDIEVQEKKIALRERDTEIRERNLAIQEKQIKLQNKAPVGGAPNLPHPPSKEKAPAAGPTKKPPPLAKENAPPKVHNTQRPVLQSKNRNPPFSGAGEKQPNTAPIHNFFMPGMTCIDVSETSINIDIMVTTDCL